MGFSEDIFKAYFDARKNKRSKLDQIEFEINYEKNLFQLERDLIDWTYTLWKSNVFISNFPVKREIFCAPFRDRVVHHLIYNYINDFYDRVFIDDAYSCRNFKWTSYWIKRIYNFIKSCSENYQKETRVLHLDISWYFMWISKEKLFSMIKKFLQKRFLDENFIKKFSERKINFLYKKFFDLQKQDSPGTGKKILDFLLKNIEKIIFNNPTKNCDIKSHKNAWTQLPKSKSLFFSKPWYWLPIWNLTSQLFWNVYLDGLDKFIKWDLKFKYYWRYVDDMILVHNSKEFLENSIPKIKEFLKEKLDLEISDKKTKLEKMRNWVDFLWWIIKPYRIYARNRTKWNFYKKIFKFNKIEEKFSKHVPGLDSQDYLISRKKNHQKFLKDVEITVNSYLWILKQFNSWKLRKKILWKISPKLRKYFRFYWYEKILMK